MLLELFDDDSFAIVFRGDHRAEAAASNHVVPQLILVSSINNPTQEVRILTISCHEATILQIFQVSLGYITTLTPSIPRPFQITRKLIYMIELDCSFR